MRVVRRSRGFSLFELMMALAIVVLILALGILQFRSPDRIQGPKAAAGVLAEAMRAARARAVSAGTPTAVVIPSADGTTASSQAFYRVEGHVFPRVTSVTELSAEYPLTHLSVLQWPAAGNETTQPATGDDFLVDAWGLLYPRDYALIFLPSGQVVSNGLVHFGGAYHVLVSSGVESSGGASTTDSPALFQLTRAAQPHTVTVTQAGAVSVEPGVTGLTDLDMIAEAAGEPVLAGAPPVTPPSQSQPEIVSVDAFPKPLDGGSGADAVVIPGGRLSLTAQAWSPEGATLYCEWSGPGQFSSPGAVEMEWDPVEAVWTGLAEWTPPEGLAPGNQVALEVQIKDQFGNQSAQLSAAAAALAVDIVPRLEKLIYAKGSFGGEGLWVVQADGTSNEQVLSDKGYATPEWSPDGSKYVAVRGGQVVLGVPRAGIVRTLTPPPGGTWQSMAVCPRWSPEGTQILYAQGGELWVVREDGTGRTNLTADIPGTVYGGYAWNPNGTQICFTLSPDPWPWGLNQDRTWVMNADGSGKIPVTNFQSRFPNWSPDGQWIACFGSFTTPPYSFVRITLVRPDGSSIGPGETAGPGGRRIVWTFPPNTGGWYGWGTPTRLGWSPDSQKVSWYMGVGNQALVRVVDINSLQVTEIPDSRSPYYQYGIWSPVQNKLAFNPTDYNDQTLLVSRDDGGGRVAVASRGTDPHFSP